MGLIEWAKDPARQRYSAERASANVRAVVQLFFQATSIPYLVVVGLFAAALAYYGQSQQFYVALLETPSASASPGLTPQIGFLVLAAAAFSLVVFRGYRAFTELTALRLRGEGRLTSPPDWINVAREVAAVSIAAAPWAALCLGLMSARGTLLETEALLSGAGLLGDVEAAATALGAAGVRESAETAVQLAIGIAATGAVVVTVLFLVRDRRIFEWTADIVALALVLLVLFSWMIWEFEYAGALAWVGPLAVTLIAAASIISVLAFLVGVVAARSGLPPLVLILGLAGFFYVASVQWVDLGDRAEEEDFKGQGEFAGLSIDEGPARQRFEQAFEDWARARFVANAGDAFPDGFPVITVAAQGGGMYAAAGATAFLARIQDRCPHFARHLFAISGVSGGSVGSALFTAYARAQKQPLSQDAACDGAPDGVLSRRLAEIATAPLAAPVIAGLALDKLFPFNSIPRLPITDRDSDRAHRLEHALLSAVRAGGAPLDLAAADILDSAFPEHWTADGAQPALALNVTGTLDGRRVAFAPFHDLAPSAADATLATVYELSKDSVAAEQQRNRGVRRALLEEPTLLEAALASARFPYILPEYVAQVRYLRVDGDVTEPFNRYSFVDGGYVDASGATTAWDLHLAARAVRALARERVKDGRGDDFDRFIAKMKPIMVILTTDWEAERLSEAGEVRGDASSPSDLVAPVRALFSVRGLRAQNAVSTVLAQFEADELREDAEDAEDAEGAQLLMLRLNVDSFDIPLAWRLSKIAHSLISTYSGRPSAASLTTTDCDVDGAFTAPRVARAPLDAISGERAAIKRRIVEQIWINDCETAKLIRELTPKD